MADGPRCGPLRRAHLPVPRHAASLHGIRVRGVLQIAHLLRHRDEVHGDRRPGEAQRVQQRRERHERRGAEEEGGAPAPEVLRGPHVRYRRLLGVRAEASHTVRAVPVLVLGPSNCVQHHHRGEEAAPSLLRVRNVRDEVGRADVHVCGAQQLHEGGESRLSDRSAHVRAVGALGGRAGGGLDRAGEVRSEVHDSGDLSSAEV
mmetsp:Transcript_40165/g.74287  ORF Transcript_40165/g.74287 Transcript_40165/m.74287 type:complete len:203 (+) Transcript_40165:400-1008(+)